MSESPHFKAMMDYSGGFYSVAIEYGLPARVAADYVKHVESAARGLERERAEAVAYAGALTQAAEKMRSVVMVAIAGQGIDNVEGRAEWDHVQEIIDANHALLKVLDAKQGPQTNSCQKPGCWSEPAFCAHCRQPLEPSRCLGGAFDLLCRVRVEAAGLEACPGDEDQRTAEVLRDVERFLSERTRQGNGQTTDAEMTLRRIWQKHKNGKPIPDDWWPGIEKIAMRNASPLREDS